MATLDSLKRTLRQHAKAVASSPTRPLSDLQYDAGFQILGRASKRTTYKDFIIPQLSLMLSPLFNSRVRVSILEVGPGPESVLGCLPYYQRRKVERYAAFEPNHLFATRLEEWLCFTSETESPLPSLRTPPDILRIPFALESSVRFGTSIGTSHGDEKFDIVLFCHSMYGMKPKEAFIERALKLLLDRPEGGMVIIFHRDGKLHLDGLFCHRTSSFPTGVIRVADDDEALDSFAAFIAGYVMQDSKANKAVHVEWRKVCRTLGDREETQPDHLLFNSPGIMMAFTHHATKLRELTAQVPVMRGENRVKNRESRLHHPASITRPKDIQDVQQCVQWALNRKASLAVIGGGHSGHCIWPNVVSVDMGAFDQIHILTAGEEEDISHPNFGTLIVAEAGCKSGDIIRKAMAAGVTVPLGARPSVGAGLWLQGGIGHLARLHGLACDAVVGAVVVSVASGQVLCLGDVPSQYQPASAVHPENDQDILWAIKGAGTNFGIMISVTFKTYVAPTYLVRNWVVPLSDNVEARLRLSDFAELLAKKLPRHCSADAYLYSDTNLLHLGVTMFESFTTELAHGPYTPASTLEDAILGPEDNLRTVDGVELFESEMYMSGMHGVAARLPRSSDDFACVVTGVWPRDQDETGAARAAVQWVYNVAMQLMPLSSGAYGADLGPDRRDTALATKAFGSNLPRLASLKHTLDPDNVLAYACPLPAAPIGQKLIILVTGDSCAGKDFCADVWVSVFSTWSSKSQRVSAVSISDATKQEYTAATGADLERLLRDRAYKEHHRPSVTTFFQTQRLVGMVRLVRNFPRSGVDFRDVLGISQEPGGLGLCTSLLRTHFADDWATADVVVSCESGGFVYASALAVQANIPMALIREAGKLPPPTFSVTKCPSYISSSPLNSLREERVEMGRDVVTRGSSVVVVDDVLATGRTLCAVLQLLNEAGIGAEAVNVMVLAEFPVHRGREFLRRRGFGGAKIQSLLVFGGS
ncbi:hypothetical protein LTR17_026613 [Elasticomyces elasticus]|nr:hypothetical protein LTR17_026613 [Elasticomyces elasticus]